MKGNMMKEKEKTKKKEIVMKGKNTQKKDKITKKDCVKKRTKGFKKIWMT